MSDVESGDFEDDEKRDFRDSVEKMRGRSSRRKILKFFGAAVGVIVTAGFLPEVGKFLFDRMTYRSNVSVADRKIYSPRYEGEQWVPGGVSFALRNDGNRKSLFTGAQITIEKYARLKACISGSGGSEIIESCYSVTLPVDVTPKKTMNVDLRQVVENENLTFCSLSFSPSEKDEGFVHLYLLDISILQDDGAAIECGKLIVATPKEELMTRYWVPDHIMQEDKLLKREEYLRVWAGSQGSNADSVIRCAEANDRAVKSIFSSAGKAFMSPVMEGVKQILKSGEYDPKTYVVPKNSAQYTPKCEKQD
jgi:hypothetical protein